MILNTYGIPEVGKIILVILQMYLVSQIFQPEEW